MRPATVAAICIVFLVGCTSIDYSREPAADFPALAVTVHRYADTSDVRAACAKAGEKYGVSVSMFLVACSDWRFDTRTCDVYVPAGDDGLLEHELAHCRGYDHYGESTIADAWRAWSVRKTHRFDATLTARTLTGATYG